MVTNRPSGTVTFLFTDIEGSTRISQEHRDAWEHLRARHHTILRSAIESNSGYVFQIVGDALCAAFDRPVDAVRAALKAQRDLQAEPWRETPIRVRMGIHTGVAEADGEVYRGYAALSSVERVMSAGHGGHVLLSQSAVELLEGALPNEATLRDLGQHRLKDLFKPQHLYQLVVADLPCDFPPLKTLEVHPHNLPVQLTSFIGREREIRELGSLVGRSRLVTLTGVGGTGKSRLALQVAAEVLHDFPDGAWLTELAPLTDPMRVPDAIAAALNVREQPGRPFLDVLKDYLGSKDLLLLLDNCEHLIEACAQATDALLHSARHLSILATSREALNIAGETAFHVRSLPLPEPSVGTAAAVSQSDAVRLFVDRAAAAQPEFQLSDHNASAVSQICTRLDGIPLAIELAAARARGMTVEQIASHLDERLQLLTGGSRTAPPRQRTLRAAIDWSYNLLSDDERALLRRLSVFAGGWTLEAAESIAAKGELQAADIRRLLPGLVEKSLISLDPEAGRYHILETLREYALEKLCASGEEADIRMRHLDYFAELADSLEVAASDDEAASFELLREHENLVSAIKWCEGAEDGVQKGLRLAGASRLNWMLISQRELGYRLVERFLSLPGAETRNPARRRALYSMAVLGAGLGRASELGWAMEESLQIAKEIGDRRGEVQALRWLGGLEADTGGYEVALRRLGEALRIAQSLPYRRLTANVQTYMAEILREKGDYAAAESLYAQIAPATADHASFAFVTNATNLAMVAIQMGHLESARLRLLQVFESVEGLPRTTAHHAALGPLMGIAGFLAAVEDWRHAAVLYGAFEQQREREGTIMETPDALFLDPLMQRVRGALGEGEYEAACAEGRRLSAADALFEAKAWLLAASTDRQQ